MAAKRKAKRAMAAEGEINEESNPSVATLSGAGH
jgi:hypothetical protein